MSFSKREFILEAYAEIGRADYAFDLQPEDLQLGLRRLDAMMAMWNAKGIRVGYPLPATPSASDLDEMTTVPDAANEAIFMNLAIRLSPNIGKTVLPETRMIAKEAYDALVSRAAMPPEMQMSALPAGAGNRRRERPFLPKPGDRLAAGPDSLIDLD